MGVSARIYSAQSLEEFRGRFSEFRQEVIEALASADAGLQQMNDWLEQQLKHWRHEEQKRSEVVIRARRELEERRHAHSRDHRGCTDQEVAYRKARQRLQEAEEKGQRCRVWLRVLPQHRTEYDGPARALAGMMDTEVVKALAILRQKVDLLAEYQALRAGVGSESESSSVPPIEGVAPAGPSEPSSPANEAAT